MLVYKQNHRPDFHRYRNYQQQPAAYPLLLMVAVLRSNTLASVHNHHHVSTAAQMKNRMLNHLTVCDSTVADGLDHARKYVLNTRRIVATAGIGRRFAIRRRRVHDHVRAVGATHERIARMIADSAASAVEAPAEAVAAIRAVAGDRRARLQDLPALPATAVVVIVAVVQVIAVRCLPRPPARCHLPDRRPKDVARVVAHPTADRDHALVLGCV